MTQIELIYSGDCPNVENARENLKESLRSLGLALEWREWDRQDHTSPEYTKAFGSPTILVNGSDVARDEPSDADCCRLYVSESEGSRVGAPPSSLIKAALKAAMKVEKRKQPGGFAWKSLFATAPAIGAALLPSLSCPACWPAYAGLLSSLGLSFINYTPYLIPLFSVLVLVALFSLWYKANTRRGYGPLLLGLLGAVFLVIGRFASDNPYLLYAGITLFVFASIWNARKRSPCFRR